MALTTCRLVSNIYPPMVEWWRILYRECGGVWVMKISTKARCVECNRVFDLLDDNDANEWAYGHDCEV